MKVSINGEEREIADGASVLALLDELGLGGRKVAVAVNREVVARAEHARRRLAPGDRIEIVHAVQGG